MALSDPPPPLGRASILSIIGFTALCGSVSLIYPFGRDQGNYAYAGWVWLDGGALYRDVFVFKPPMTVAVHSLAMSLFGVNTWAIRVLDIGWTAATALLVAAIALELWKRRDSAVAAGLTCPFLYYQIDYWTTAQTDGWMTLPSALAVWAVLRGGRALPVNVRKALAWWTSAGALAGVAVLFKYTAALVGVPMLVAFAWVASRQGRRAWRGIAAALVGGLTTLIACWLWLLATGAWSAFVESQLELIPEYVGRRPAGQTPTDLLGRLFTLKRTKTDLLPLFWAGPIGLAPGLLASRPRTRSDWLAFAIPVTWWLVAASNVVVQGKFFDYHYLPLLAPSSIMAGLGIAALLRRPLASIHRREGRALVLTALMAAAIAVTPIGGRFVEIARVAVGGHTIDEYIASRREYAFPAYNVRDIRRVSELLRETTTPEQRVFLWGYEPTINVRARRHTVSRFLYNFPLRMAVDSSRYEEELIHALSARPPDVIVVTKGDRFPGLTGTYKDSTALLAEFDELDAFVKQRYERAETVGRYSLWRRIEPGGQPNVIVITVDTLRADRLGAYGHASARTPHVDALAASGATFTNAFAPMGRTTPSLASMWTGLWPHEHGSREVHEPILQGTLMTTLLKSAGYATVGVTANPAAGRGQGFAEGFDTFVQVGDQGPDERWYAEDVTDQAVALTRDAPRDQPILLWTHYLDPHWPYQPPTSQDSKAVAACSSLSRIERGARESNVGGHAEKQLSNCLEAYDEELSYTDAQIGELLSWLREDGRLQDAVIIFTSDHGESFGEAGLYYAHGPDVHDASLRVPLVIAGKDIEAGARHEDVIRLIDLAPTIASLAGVERAKHLPMSGIDFAATVRNGSPPEQQRRLAFAESGGTLIRGNHSHLLSGRPKTGYCLNDEEYSLCWRELGTPALFHRTSDPSLRVDVRKEDPDVYSRMLEARERWKPGMTRERSVSDGQFKLVERPRFEGGYERALYDTQADPAETIDLREAEPRIHRQLAKALTEWTANVPGYAQGALSDEVEEQLEALGYVE